MAKARELGKDSIEALVNRLNRGDIRLPEMQREYVWKQEQVRALFDSLYREYPSGTILTWRPRDEEDVELREFAVSQNKKKNDYELLLDGQQRLTSLAALLSGKPVTVHDRKRPIDIFFNLEHPDDVEDGVELPDDKDESDDSPDAGDKEKMEETKKMTFVVSNNRFMKGKHWISVSELFKDGSPIETLKRIGITDLEDPLCKKYEERLRRLLNVKNYDYPVYEIDKNKSYKEVAEIFTRVNSGGTKLRASDLALAQITAKWKGSLKIFQEVEKQYQDRNYDMGISNLLRGLVVFGTNQCKFRALMKSTPDELKDSWEKVTVGLEHAVNFLINNVKIENVVLLSSPFIVITVAYHAYHNKFKISPQESDLLRYWVLMASLKGRYSRGSTESYLDQDLKTIRESIKSGTSCAKGLLESLKRQAGRLDIEGADLHGLSSKSAVFKTMFIIFKEDGAKDWDSSVGIDFNRRDKKKSERQKLEFHHIFPKKVLKDEEYGTKKMDDIRNLAFIDAPTNKRLGKTPPWEYLADVDASSLKAQCVPENETYWNLDSYERFLNERGRLITERLNKFLGTEPTGIN